MAEKNLAAIAPGGLFGTVRTDASPRSDEVADIPVNDAERQARLVRIYETILATTDDFVYIFDPQGRFLYANSSLLEVWAKTLPQVIGKTCHDLGYPTWHADMHMREIEEIVRNKVPIRGEVPFTGASGIAGVYDYIFKPVLDAEGNVELIVGTTRDVTDRKRDEEKLKEARLELQQRADELELALRAKSESEQALRASESKLRLYFESSIVGNIMADINGSVFEANDEYLRIIGYSREELIASQVRWDEITPSEFLPLDYQAIEVAKRTGVSGPYEKQYIRKDGSRIWVIVGFVIYDEDKTIAFILDISGRKAAETALREAQAKLLAHSVDLEATVESRTAKLHEIITELEHFSYAIVHDLRAPLRAMEGYADMMEEELANGELTLTREYCRRIKMASRRMDHLIADSLNYSKAARQELTLVPVNLFNLLDGIIQTYPNLRSEAANIVIERNLPIVLGNEAALTQCFSNLLGNAIKFSKVGAKPQITIRAEPSPRLTRETQESSSRPCARIWVEDNGIGISKEAQSRIFDLFQRATKDREGTGLGLAIVRKVVERMGGRVGVESELGAGSRFWIELAVV